MTRRASILRAIDDMQRSKAQREQDQNLIPQYKWLSIPQDNSNDEKEASMWSYIREEVISQGQDNLQEGWTLHIMKRWVPMPEPSTLRNVALAYLMKQSMLNQPSKYFYMDTDDIPSSQAALQSSQVSFHLIFNSLDIKKQNTHQNAHPSLIYELMSILYFTDC